MHTHTHTCITNIGLEDPLPEDLAGARELQRGRSKEEKVERHPLMALLGRAHVVVEVTEDLERKGEDEGDEEDLLRPERREVTRAALTGVLVMLYVLLLVLGVAAVCASLLWSERIRRAVNDNDDLTCRRRLEHFILFPLMGCGALATINALAGLWSARNGSYPSFLCLSLLLVALESALAIFLLKSEVSVDTDNNFSCTSLEKLLIQRIEHHERAARSVAAAVLVLQCITLKLGVCLRVIAIRAMREAYENSLEAEKAEWGEGRDRLGFFRDEDADEHDTRQIEGEFEPRTLKPLIQRKSYDVVDFRIHFPESRLLRDWGDDDDPDAHDEDDGSTTSSSMDDWRQRMREKYGIDTSLFQYNPEEGGT